ncbi:MAG TPA: glycosyltransferase, partial [Blastocatellia bacterium]|nr:glycosyltransferase [Blastocatellia bacterium]
MKILWLKADLLHPVDKGGKIRTYHMLKSLKRDHHITYVALDDGTAPPDARERAAEYADELVAVPHNTRAKFSAGFYAELAANLASPLPYAVSKYRSPALGRELATRMKRCRPDLLVCDFLAPSINLPREIPYASLLFQHNVEAIIWKRHWETQANPLKRIYLRDQWRKMRAYERALCRRFDHVVAVSREDAETIRAEYGIDAVTDVPTGVDTEYFKPSGLESPEPYNLVFTGSMDWLPNEDAIRYFTGGIMPRIKRAVPGVTLTVVGRDPYPSLVELSRRDPSIIVTGRVDDVRPFMERAAAYIVPLRIGGGTRLKIYEAMAMEKAIVSTTIGAEGLPVKDGVDLLLADDEADFADAVVRVLKDKEYAHRLGVSAAARVRESFGWDRVAAKFAEVCERTLQQSSARAERRAEVRFS